MNKHRHLIAGLLVSVVTLAACGGGDDASLTTDDAVATTQPADPPATDPPVTEPPATDPPVTDPPVTEPPATDPPVTEPPGPALPDWASGELVTVQSDTGPLELPVELAAFCEPSRSFYIAARGLDFLDVQQSRSAEQLFLALGALAPLAIDAAPSDEFATQPIAARDALAVIVPGFQEIGWDRQRTAELSDLQAFGEAIEQLTETVASLRSFLLDACGADTEVLDTQARGAAEAAAIAADEVLEVPPTTVAAEAVPGTAIANDASTITLSVPADWVQTEESLESGRDQLVASSNIDTFYGLATPGVLVLRGEGGFRDGGFVGRVLEFEADLLEIGCQLLDQVDYDDGLYIGQERTYDCGTEGLDVRLLGGTTADESLYAMVMLIHPTNEPGIRQLIVDTFQVS
ncbi:MAG: hypothetical protein ACE37B_18445 [Ilumatobacter sp.]|uniref:hypothetical protein n=1 Tax=Ilumatobacter sp. TaxID=1967498 RepID=UPI00391AD1E4